jgi:hypothetical protein
LSELSRPDGIEQAHIHEAHHSVFRRWPFTLVSLSALMILALLGAFGSDVRITEAGDRVELTVDGPGRIRNGCFFETLLVVDTRRDIRDLVFLVDKDIWYEVTVNTVLPEPSEYGYRNGSFELRFGRLEADKSLVIKVAAQINSGRRASTNEGNITLADGDAVLATIHYAMEVLP